MQNKQRKGCELNFVQGDSRRGKKRDKQRRALRSDLENMRFRAMGGVLGVSNVTVLNWIRQAGHWIKAYQERQIRLERVKTIALDSIFLDSICIGQKKSPHTWLFYEGPTSRYKKKAVKT